MLSLDLNNNLSNLLKFIEFPIRNSVKSRFYQFESNSEFQLFSFVLSHALDAIAFCKLQVSVECFCLIASEALQSPEKYRWLYNYIISFDCFCRRI